MTITAGPARAAVHPSHRAGSRPKQASIDLLTACFSFPGLSNLADALTAHRPTRAGARAQHPDICMLAVLAAARAVGGVQPVVRELNAADRFAWKKCSALLMARIEGLRLPPTPPTRDQITSFQRRVTEDGGIDVLEQAFIDASVKMAKWMGHFDVSTAPDWVRPDPKHAIYGDGTVIAPFSGASEWVHPLTGEVVIRDSRARDASTARIQRVRTDTTIDGKADLRGINFVSMHTWTSSGRVMLATGHALGAETLTAVDLMRAVQERAQGGVHTVIYDGVVTGWIVDWLMGSLRIQAVNKIAAASTTDPHVPSADHPLRRRPALEASAERAQRALVAAGLAVTPELVRYEQDAALDRLYTSDVPLPVGLCLYPRSKSNSYEIVYSQHHEIETAEHTVDGERCAHRLVVDDGALYVAEEDIEREHLVKTAMPVCTEATAHLDRGTWNRRTTWQIPCERGAFAHELTWRPAGTFHPKRTTGRTPRVDPLAELRPLARAHEGYGEVFGRRNDSESYNQWFQAGLRHPGVAMSLSLGGQRLDFLMGAVLNNAITYGREMATRRG
ncbi:hypothetical protein ACGIF2_15755 [Cellulomonas sp. P22]|uniref:hypothetical protein n=1 Tax=Cellulomonas sp. P22 TaxID=3373189 RepID=UPI0037AAF3E4